MTTLNQALEIAHPRSGYTIDEDGRLNNYAIEPEMYVNEPGDLRQKTEQAKIKRLQELAELQVAEAGEVAIEDSLS